MEPNQAPKEGPDAASGLASFTQPTIITPSEPAAAVPSPQPAVSLPAEPATDPIPPTPLAGIPQPEQATPSDTVTPEPRLDQPMISEPAPALQPGADGTLPVSPPASLPPTPPTSPTVSPAAGSPVPGGRGKKKLLFGGGIALVVLLLAGAVFGLYLPNTPSHVWNTGVNRSGEALDSLVQNATTAKQLEAYKTSHIDGTLDFHAGSSKYSGSFTTSFDKTSLDGGLTINLQDKDSAKQAIVAKVLSQLPKDSLYPDLYFQISGLKSLGVDEFVPGISTYDGQWISVSSGYLKSLGDGFLASGDNTTSQVTSGDIAELARAASGVTRDYLFSTSKDKGVFIEKSFEGKEKLDGMSTYHYKVGINIDHAKAYCTALTQAALSTDAYPKLSGETKQQISDEKKAAAKDCASTAKDDLKSDSTYDLWIDGHYKLIYKIRAYDTGSKENYTDVGQVYKGGDKLSLFVTYHDASSQSNTKLVLDTDLTTNATKLKLTSASIDSSFPYNLTMTLTAGVSSKPVTITKPASSVPLQDVLNALGLGGFMAAPPAGSIGTKAEDTERQTDIRSLQAALEAYYASTGQYPTLEQLNSSSWRSANLKGIDASLFTTPDGTSNQLLGSATAGQYGYNPLLCNTTGCKGYSLSAMLSDGTLYTKSSE
jgi:hypothetical protein